MSLDQYGFEVGYVEATTLQDRIIERLKASPNDTYAKIAADMGCSARNVRYHARTKLKLGPRLGKGLPHWSKRQKGAA